jgi:ABC-type sugar transport system ATPase subunit
LGKDYLLRLEGISKSFGGVRALQDIDLEVNYNEVLAIVGDNGAGKSTLVKIISGAIPSDEGKMFLEGEEIAIKNPRDAASLGIQMCYQDLALVDCLDVVTNIFLGREIYRRILGLIDFLSFRKMREESVNHLKSLGIELHNVGEKVKNLSGGQRQVIAVSRAVYWGTKLVILDEPTAALGVKEAKRVNELIKNLKNKNISVIVISHNLQHVFYVSDRVVVLRHGSKVGERVIKETDGDEVVKMITGAEFNERETSHYLPKL